MQRLVVEEDNCHPDVVELVRSNLAEVCNATNSDDCLSGGGAKDIAVEPGDTDARKDGWAVIPSSTPHFHPPLQYFHPPLWY